MTGEELFDQYISQRDYSGSKADEYAQLLFTLILHIGDDLYDLLLKAEKDNKKLTISDTNEQDEYTLSDVILA